MTEPEPGCPSTTKHGTSVAYQHYGCRCDSARREARRRHIKWRLAAKEGPLRIDAVGTRRRLRALSRAGWTFAELGERLGVSGSSVSQYANAPGTVYRRTWLAVARLYDSMELEPGSSAHASGRAEAAGWPGPERWFGVDMDDPAAQPKEPEVVVVDDVVVERLVAGDYEGMSATRDERAAAARRLKGSGLNHREIATRMRVTHSHVDYLIDRC